MILAAGRREEIGMAQRITEIIDPSVSLPAIGQGAIGIECRTSDEFISSLIAL